MDRKDSINRETRLDLPRIFRRLTTPIARSAFGGVFLPPVSLFIACLFFFTLLFFFVFVRTELHSLQGMEFLEGFGKKKQQPHQQLNNLSSIHINPLSAQSLNIHLHGILSFILFFFRVSSVSLIRFYDPSLFVSPSDTLPLRFTRTLKRKHKNVSTKTNCGIVALLLSALFAAVEHGHLDKARTILESTDVDVNR